MLLQDATFELERRRNRPEKYDRQLMHKTVQAMQKVEEVGMRLTNVLWTPPCRTALELRVKCIASCMWRAARVREQPQKLLAHAEALDARAWQVRVKRQERFYEARMARAKGAQVRTSNTCVCVLLQGSTPLAAASVHLTRPASSVSSALPDCRVLAMLHRIFLLLHRWQQRSGSWRRTSAWCAPPRPCSR